jgi:hypothetical protein
MFYHKDKSQLLQVTDSIVGKAWAPHVNHSNKYKPAATNLIEEHHKTKKTPGLLAVWA